MTSFLWLPCHSTSLPAHRGERKKGSHGNEAFTHSCFPSLNLLFMHGPFPSPNSTTVISAGGVTTDGAQRLCIYTSQARCWGDAALWGWEDLFFSPLQFLTTGLSVILHDIWETNYLRHSCSPQERFDITAVKFLTNLKVKNEAFFWVGWEGVELSWPSTPQGLSAYTQPYEISSISRKVRALNLPRYKKDGLGFGGCINYFTVKYDQKAKDKKALKQCSIQRWRLGVGQHQQHAQGI